MKISFATKVFIGSISATLLIIGYLYSIDVLEKHLPVVIIMALVITTFIIGVDYVNRKLYQKTPEFIRMQNVMMEEAFLERKKSEATKIIGYLSSNQFVSWQDLILLDTFRPLDEEIIRVMNEKVTLMTLPRLSSLIQVDNENKQLIWNGRDLRTAFNIIESLYIKACTDNETINIKTYIAFFKDEMRRYERYEGYTSLYNQTHDSSKKMMANMQSVG